MFLGLGLPLYPHGGTANTQAWYDATSYSTLAAVADFNNDRYALPTFGSELISNGGFDSDTVWTKGTNTTITDGQAVKVSGSSSEIVTQVLSLVAGAMYEITWTVVSLSSGSTHARLTTGTSVVGSNMSGTGTHKAYLSATSGNDRVSIFTSGTTVAATIDNVSVKEVVLTPTGRTYGAELLDNGDFSGAAVADPATGWVLKSPAVGTESMSISGGTVNLAGDGTNQAWVDQSFVTTAATTYELAFTVPSGGSGILLAIGTSQGGTQLAAPSAFFSNADHVMKFTATGALTWIRFYKLTTGTGRVDTASIRALTAIGTYPKRSATFDEFFAYTAASTAARTYTDNAGVLRTMDQAGFGAEMLTNGGFATDLTGWTNNSPGTGTAAWDVTGGGSLKLTRTDSSNYGRVYQTFTGLTVGTSYRVSATIVSGTAAISCGLSTSPTGSLIAGSISNQSGAGTYTADIIATATTMSLLIFNNTNGLDVYVGDTSLKPSLGLNARRMTYANGKRQLRLENAGTNLTLYSEDFLNTTHWTQSNGVTTLGTNGWHEYREDTANTFHRVYRNTTTTVAASTVYTWSALVRKAGRRYLYFRGDIVTPGTTLNVGFDLDTATVTYASAGYAGTITAVPQMGAGVYRLTVTATTNATTTARGYGLASSNAAVVGDASVAFAGDTAQGFDIRYQQLEASAFATNYIPTTSASVTRAIETARLSPLLEAILQRAQGSVVVRCDLVYAAVQRIVGIDASNAFLDKTATPTNIRVKQTSSNDFSAILGSGTNTDPMGAAMGHGAAGVSLCGNGGAVATSSNTMGTRSTVYLGRAATVSGDYADGFYDFLGVSPERLPDSNLQALAVAA